MWSVPISSAGPQLFGRLKQILLLEMLPEVSIISYGVGMFEFQADTLLVTSFEILCCPAQGRSGSFDAAIGIVRETAEYVVRFCSDLYQVVRSNSLARISSLFALSVALVTALLNTWLTGYLHKNVLPSVASEVSILLEREVRPVPHLPKSMHAQERELQSIIARGRS